MCTCDVIYACVHVVCAHIYSHFLPNAHVFDFIPNYHALWTQTTAHTFIAAVVTAYHMTTWYQQHQHDTYVSVIHAGMDVMLRAARYLHPKLQSYAHTSVHVLEVDTTWYHVRLHDDAMVYIQSGAVVGDTDTCDDVDTTQLMIDIQTPTHLRDTLLSPPSNVSSPGVIGHNTSRPPSTLSLPTLPDATTNASLLSTSTTSAFTPMSSSLLQSPGSIRARTSSAASTPPLSPHHPTHPTLPDPMLTLTHTEPPLVVGQHVMIRSHPLLLRGGAAWLIGMDAIVTHVPNTVHGTYTVRLNNPQQQVSGV